MKMLKYRDALCICWNVVHDIYSAKECNELLSTLSFFTKKDNCAGLQIADFVRILSSESLMDQRIFYNVKSYLSRTVVWDRTKSTDNLGFKSIMINLTDLY